MNARDLHYVAHRGDHAAAPENTLEAFAAALARRRHNPRIVGIELDVQITADGKIVVCHDPDLQRVFGLDLSIVENTAATLHEATDGKLPLLDNVIDLVGHGVELLVEVKDYGTAPKPLAAAVVGVVRRHGGREIVLNAFSPAVLDELLALTADLPMRCGYLFADYEAFRARPAAWLNRLDSFHVQWQTLLRHPNSLAVLGKRVYAWTITRPGQLGAMTLLRPVPVIITDDLTLAEG